MISTAIALQAPAPVEAIFGLGDGVLGMFLTLAVFGLIAVWIALIFFTYNDARKRISDPFLIGCSTAASFFPFVGTLVYTILRPPEFLDDAKEREWDVRATQAQLRRVRAGSCRKCGYPAESDFLRCPSCRSRLREPCPSCDRPVGLGWKLCPYCETTLIEPKRKPEGRRSRTKGSKSGQAAAGSPSKGSRAKAARGRVRSGAGDEGAQGAAGMPTREGEKPINAGEDQGDR
ncbi:MAG: double zinc ribbon domain-containing protein [Solirubrobacterales bacterium]